MHGSDMQFVCDATDGKTWFRIESDAEAAAESETMKHAVEKYFRREREKSLQTYQPTSALFIEQNIGLAAHVQRAMPLFLTLRDKDGVALVTAMLPPGGKDDDAFRMIIVGQNNGDPYPAHGDAIAALAKHFGLMLG